MKIGFIFAGQGQQFLDMGKDLVESFDYAKDIYARAESILGYSLLDLSKDQLANTEYTQPALFTLGAVLDKLIKDKDIKPDYVAGLSLGEYNALLSAKVISFDHGLKIIAKRAKLMANAFEANTTGMIACLKTNANQIEKLLVTSSLEICNFNSASQIVIGGKIEEVKRMLPILKENKILAIPLKVSTVSHMSLLSEAALELELVLKDYNFDSPIINLISNIDGQVQVDDFINSLSRHICQPTHLHKSVLTMYEAGVRHFIEVGPKGSISKLIKEIIVDDITIDNIYDIKTLEGVNYE